MKKTISLVLFFLSFGIYLGYSYYIKGPFDYHVAQFAGYFFYWNVALFIMSLFALTLNGIKYRKWLIFTLIFVIFSMLVAYTTGDGNDSIINFDGELLTFISICIYSLVSIIYFTIQFFKKEK